MSPPPIRGHLAYRGCVEGFYHFDSERQPNGFYYTIAVGRELFWFPRPWEGGYRSWLRHAAYTAAWDSL